MFGHNHAGATYVPVSDFDSAFMIGGMVGTEYTTILGGGRAGHANGLFDQTTQCPQPPYWAMAIDASPTGPSWWLSVGYGGNVWVR